MVLDRITFGKLNEMVSNVACKRKLLIQTKAKSSRPSMQLKWGKAAGLEGLHAKLFIAATIIAAELPPPALISHTIDFANLPHVKVSYRKLAKHSKDGIPMRANMKYHAAVPKD